MASIKDVAEIAGVSISTVSNVINNTKYVSGELKKKIFDAIAELQYEVDPVARSLKSKRTMTLGVVITNINRVFFTQVIKGIQDGASKLGYNITLYSTDDSFERERHFIQMLESSWVDGIILDSVADRGSEDYFKQLTSLGNTKKHIPVVSLERNLDSYGIHSVVVNNYLGASMAVKHLIDCGCGKIVHVTGPLISCMVQDRLNGYGDEMARAGFKVDDSMVIEGDFSPLSGYKAMKQFLMDGIEPDGVFAANDQMAIGAIKALNEYGYKIPEAVKVVGFDNTFIASIVEPSLTTVNVPKYKLGTSAVDILTRIITENSESAVNCEVPINLVIRQSTDLRGEKNWDLYGW